MPKYFISKDGQVHSWSYDLALGTMVRSGVSGSVANESMRIAESLLNEHDVVMVDSVTWTLISEEIRRGNLSQTSALVKSMKSGPMTGTVPRTLPKVDYFQYVLGLVRVIDLVRVIGAKSSVIDKKLLSDKKDRDQWLWDLLAANLGRTNSDIAGLRVSTANSFSSEGALIGGAKDALVKMTDKWRISSLGKSLKKMGFNLEKDFVGSIIGTSEGTIDSATKTLLSQNVTPFSREEARSALAQDLKTSGNPLASVWNTVLKAWAAIGGGGKDSEPGTFSSGGVRGTPHPDAPDETGKLWENFIALSPLWRFNPNEIGQPMPFSENTNSNSTDSRTISRHSRVDRTINWGPDGGGLSTDATSPPPVIDLGGRVPGGDPIPE